MIEYYKNNTTTSEDLNDLLNSLDFDFPKDFVDFFKKTNGAYVYSDACYLHLWSLAEIIQFNKDYNVQKFAPDFYLFGSDGGDMAYAFEKIKGGIYEMPFIGMSKEEAAFKCSTFEEFINTYN